LADWIFETDRKAEQAINPHSSAVPEPSQTLIPSPPPPVLSAAIIEGLVENLANSTYKLQPEAEKLMLTVLKNIIKSSSDESWKWRSDLVHQFVRSLASLCYDVPWHRKLAGVRGLNILLTEIELPKSWGRWLETREFLFVRALIYPLKDMPSETPPEVDFVGGVLLALIKRCHTKSNDEPLMDKEDESIRTLGNVIASDLYYQVPAVREYVKKVFFTVEECAKRSIQELFPRELKDRTYTTIFNKPLRTLGISFQVGYIDAITFAMSVKPPLVDSKSDQMWRFITECIGIAEAEDVNLLGRSVAPNSQTLLVQLRVACIKLLTVVLTDDDFQAARPGTTNQKILMTYFKLLYNKSEEVVDTACESLKTLLSTAGKMSKTMLHEALKPILGHLSDYKKLDVRSLRGLASLLTLLRTYFKPGERNFLSQLSTMYS
jgi:transformation/transcription domain-associated protein